MEAHESQEPVQSGQEVGTEVTEELLVHLLEKVVQRQLEPVLGALGELFERKGMPRRSESEALLTAVEVAELLKCDRRTVRRLELSGEMPVGIRIGGSKRWRADVLRRWLDGLSSAAGEEWS